MSVQNIASRFRIEGMDCASCARKVEGAALRVEGVTAAEASVITGVLAVRHQGADLDAVARGIATLGYGVREDGHGDGEPGAGCADDACGCGCHAHEVGDNHAHGQDDDHDHHHGHHHGHDHDADAGAWWRSTYGRLTIAVGLGAAVAYGLTLVAPAIAPYAFYVVVVAGLLPIARRALAGARVGAPLSIETLLVIAAVGALILGAEEEAAAVVFLFLVGELLEGYAATKARGSIRALSSLLPETALVETADTLVERPAAALAVGDRVRVRPGDRVPCDGVVVEGTSEIDLSMLTGESLPVVVAAGDRVHAGTINGDGLLRVSVDAPARETAVARIVRLVTEAQETKAPVERFVNRFARAYTPAVVAVASLVAVVPPVVAGGLWSDWIYRGLAVLLIGCPCALVISTPAAMAAALSSGARRGLLIKGGAVLERLGAVDAVAFDKTGTLTLGAPEVVAVEGFGIADGEVVAQAAALEATSSHPLAKAVASRAASVGIGIAQATEVTALPGRGLAGIVDGRRVFLGSLVAAGERTDLPVALVDAAERLAGDGRTVTVLVVDDIAVGLLGFGDRPRPDAAEALADLEARGIATIMLTGDNPAAAEATGRALGIDVRAGLLPEDKLDIVRQWRESGKVVAKVGDGVNDAPALAAADVGIAIGSGTDVALEAADAALLHGRIGDVAAMIDLSKRALANVRQNITVALGLKAAFLVTTVLGITGLWPAIMADTGATVLVTANALRLLAVPDDD